MKISLAFGALVLLSACAPSGDHRDCIRAQPGFVLDTEKYATETVRCKPARQMLLRSPGKADGASSAELVGRDSEGSDSERSPSMTSTHAGPGGASVSHSDSASTVAVQAGPSGASVASTSGDGSAQTASADAGGASGTSLSGNGDMRTAHSSAAGASATSKDGDGSAAAYSGPGGAGVSSFESGQSVSVHAGPGGVSNSAVTN